MEVIIAEMNKITTIEKVEENQEIIINEGLLKGQIFDVEDIQKMKAGESIECFGYNKIFDLSFDKTFE